MLSRWRGGIILLAIFLIIGRAVAQPNCPALVQDALQSIVTSCEGVGRNQVCYGNLSLHATPQPDAPAFTFDHVGDIIDVLHLQKLKLDPMDETRGIWGLAMMQLQANIPDTLPGQNVTFLLFGDVEIENRAADGQTPMQAFYLRSGVGDAACNEAPESGVLIQTPHGVESVSFNINGVDVEVGSTIMLQAQPAGDFTIRTLEGAAVVTMEGSAYPVIAGTQMSLPVDEKLEVTGQPSLPTPLSEQGLESLPTEPLPREIPAPAPLPDAALMKLQMRIEAGLEPCGVPGLPECEHALAPEEQRVWAAEASFAPSPTETPQSDIILSTPTALDSTDLSIVPTVVSGPGNSAVTGNTSLPVTLPDTGGGAFPPVGNGVPPVGNVVPPVVPVVPNPNVNPGPPAPPNNEQAAPPDNQQQPPTTADNPPPDNQQQPPPPDNQPPPVVEQPPPAPPNNEEAQSGNKDKQDKTKEKKDKEEKDKDKDEKK
jgi:hypothetical protein